MGSVCPVAPAHAYDPKRKFQSLIMHEGLGEDTQMAVQRLARWSLGITMLFAVVAAVAQTNSPAAGTGGGGKFRAACGEDVQRFCVGMQPGGGRLVQCLSSHTSELSEYDRGCGPVIRTCSDIVSVCNPAEAASFNVYRPVLVSCRQRAGI